MESKTGYWCLHCELCIREADVRMEMVIGIPGIELLTCCHCGATGHDLFPIKGQFQTGTHVNMHSDEFDVLRKAAK